MLDLAKLFSDVKDINGSFGGQVWKEVKVLGTLTPDQYDLEQNARVNKGTGEMFDSNQLLMKAPGTNETVAINIKSGEPIDGTLTYKLVQFVCLRDIEGTKYNQGSKVVKAVAVPAPAPEAEQES